MGVEGEEREKRKTETETDTESTLNHVTSHHTTHAPPFPSTFDCVLDGS